MHSNGDKNPKIFGSGGDCQSWDTCPEARIGSFKIALPNSVQIDWTRTNDWTTTGWLGSGYDASEIMTNFQKSARNVSASCGGWCGECLPDGQIFILPTRYNWGQWGEWSICTEMCSTGSQNRTRECMDGIDLAPEEMCTTGNATETADCNTEPCSRCLQPMLDSMCQSNEFEVCSDGQSLTFRA